jgi:tetratricopeptide (TPR) repeat protein
VVRSPAPVTPDTASRYASIQRALDRLDWSGTSDLCKEILRRDPGNLYVHYAAGRCRGELGHFEEARTHFATVPAADSTYRDVLYQWARVEEFDNNLGKAALLGERQLHRYPHDARAFVGVFHILRHFIAATDPVIAVEFLREQDDPIANFYIAELHRRRKEYSAAEDLYRALRQRGDVPLQAIELALAKRYAATGEAMKAQEEY